MSADLPIQTIPKSARRERRYVLRLPPAMLSHIDAAAKAAFRTRTAEIHMRIEASMANESIDEHGCIVVHAKPAIK